MSGIEWFVLVGAVLLVSWVSVHAFNMYRNQYLYVVRFFSSIVGRTPPIGVLRSRAGKTLASVYVHELHLDKIVYRLAAIKRGDPYILTIPDRNKECRLHGMLFLNYIKHYDLDCAIPEDKYLEVEEVMGFDVISRIAKAGGHIYVEVPAGQ